MPGLWHPYAYINGGGMNLEWFSREIANAGRAGKREMDLQELDRLGEELASDEPLPLFVPHMEGRVCPGQPHIRGAWIGLSWKHTLAHLYKSMLESVAMEYAIYLKIMLATQSQLAFTGLRVTGGGAESAFWNRIKSSVLGLPVAVVVGNQGAPAGAAMVAGVGAGLFEGLADTARRWVTLGQWFQPEKEAAQMYQGRVEQYKRLLELVNELGVQDNASETGSSK